MYKVALAISLTFVSFPAQSKAQNFDVGLAAAQKGDYATALQEWRPLAEQGYAAAQANLGVLYDGGMGVPQNYNKAASWYRAAAEQDNVRAQRGLGWIWVRHLQFSEPHLDTYITAHMWLNIAAANGDDRARVKRDIIEKSLSPFDILEAQRRASTCLSTNYRDCD